MSRLESISKAGYYPTPPSVVDRIAALIRPARAGPRKAVRLLDPCCGTGAALRQLADSVGGETYGIEIASDRCDKAKAVLDHVLSESAFSVRMANSAFSCLLLNPPYEYDEEDKRLEHAFLTEVTRALCPGGLLIFIVPQRRLAVSARYLAGHYTRLNCYRFPSPDYDGYQQVVLLAEKREAVMTDQRLRERIEGWSLTGEGQELPPAGSLDPFYDLPLLPQGPVLFASMFFDPEAAALEAREHGLWVSPALAERLWPAEEHPVRPLMPLRRGHLAVLIAAGFLNNILLEADGRRLLVKGRTYKESVPVESGDPEVEIEREVLRTSVMALDLDNGGFEAIQQAGSTQAHDEERQAA
ncbi:MAG: methyltransferase domain-containing protein [Dehalococcoidia bacterium]|nr:methyltransferase domain-containing protein [Dehalococcoidia bacterium]